MTTTDRDRFYAERDRRTRAYGVVTDRLDTPVRINVGTEAAASPVGQALALAVINMVCRVHRRVQLLLPDTDLLIPSLVPATTFAEAGEALAVAIDPFIDLAASKEPSLTLAIGDAVGNYWLGADGYIGYLADGTAPITDHPASMLGAGVAACLGSAALLLAITGSTVRTRGVSLWGLDNQPVLDPGPRRPIMPIDVGERVVVVGAGAVGSAILYWLRLLGVREDWTVVDGDIVKLHNTNRSLGMLAADAGWARGVPGGPVADKAESGAALIGATPIVGWYDDWAKSSGPRPDLLIPAGGERNIRRNLGLLGLPLMIQGATSPDWQVQLHRHGPSDSCPACRFRDQPTADLACATGQLPATPGAADEGESVDAALPFLSAAAGLLVVAALTRLMDGYLEQPVNQHGLLFGPHTQVDWWNTITQCRPGCTGRVNQSVRRRLNAGRRWAMLEDQG